MVSKLGILGTWSALGCSGLYTLVGVGCLIGGVGSRLPARLKGGSTGILPCISAYCWGASAGVRGGWEMAAELLGELLYDEATVYVNRSFCVATAVVIVGLSIVVWW